MKVLIDTNILLSASLNPSGVPYQAYVKAVTHPNYGFITDQNIDELRRVFNRKFPHKIPALERFLALVLTVVEVVQTPVGGIADEVLVRDASDVLFFALPLPRMWIYSLPETRIFWNRVLRRRTL